MKIARWEQRLWVASPAIAGLLFITAITHSAQQPGNKAIPVQLKVERQNAIMKLELSQKEVQDRYVNCQQQAQADFGKDSAEIQKQVDDGIKELGLDPATHTIAPGQTFYVVEKQAQPKVPEKK